MDDFPRRRRLQPQEPKKGGGIPIFPLMLLVVFIGLLLGGGLAKLFGGPRASATPAPTFTALPSQAPTPTFAPRATPHRSASPSPSKSPLPSPSPTPSASNAAKSSPTPTRATPTAPAVIYITPQPKASVVKTLAPKTPAPRTPAPIATVTASPAPTATGDAGSNRAASIVRAYLAAVLRGDEATATGYLSRGLPNESFYTGASKITDVETRRNTDGSYTVAVDMTSPTGEYYETFKLVEGPGGLGLQIADHYAIKVQ